MIRLNPIFECQLKSILDGIFARDSKKVHGFNLSIGKFESLIDLITRIPKVNWTKVVGCKWSDRGNLQIAKFRLDKLQTCNLTKRRTNWMFEGTDLWHLQRVDSWISWIVQWLFDMSMMLDRCDLANKQGAWFQFGKNRRFQFPNRGYLSFGKCRLRKLKVEIGQMDEFRKINVIKIYVLQSVKSWKLESCMLSTGQIENLWQGTPLYSKNSAQSRCDYLQGRSAMCTLRPNMDRWCEIAREQYTKMNIVRPG